ncbi:MAG: hypothetical protein IPL96_01360 [Holophagaceae bacterium]|nr:hypothetical protein [Holophagaceae bacterium]
MSTGLSRVSLLAVALALQLACGGGGGGGGGTTTPPKPPTGSLGITPGSAAVASGTSLRLTALTSNVTGASAYTWSVQETGMGQLLATGDGRAADYLAPATTGTYHVLVSTVPAGLSASAEVKVASADDSSFFRLQISPYKMNMKVRETARSGAKARGKKEVLPPPPLKVDTAADLVDVPVIWSIAEGALGGSVVPATGVYTAPAQPGVYHLVATAIENPRVQGSMEIRVFDELPPLVAAVGGSVATRPGVAYLEPLDQTFLRAVASGTASPLVAWSLLEGSTGGTLSAPTGGPDNEVAYTAAPPAGPFTPRPRRLPIPPCKPRPSCRSAPVRGWRWCLPLPGSPRAKPWTCGPW